MEAKKERNLIFIIIVVVLAIILAVVALPLYGPGPFRTGPACDLEFLHVKLTDGNATDTLSMAVLGTTPGVDMQFFVNDQQVAEKMVNPDDTISIQGDFGDVGDEVEVEVITKFGDLRYKGTVTIQAA